MDGYEFAIIGLGAMGSAAAYQLAKRGKKVLGIDRFAPPHSLGSSHGETRITRLAIGEGVQYTPLAMRSHQIWREIESEAGAELLTVTGGLIMSSGSRTGMLHVEDFFANTVKAAETFRIPHEILSAGDIRRRFPQFQVRDGEVGYYEPDAGFLRPEACIAAQLQLARKYGAAIQTGETVLGFEPRGDGVIVRTKSGVYHADRLIVAAGAWLPELIGAKHAAHFKVFRQVLLWFDIDGPAEQFFPGRFPIFIWELQGPKQAMYGFPAIDGARGGVKVATQQYERTTTPESVERAVVPEEAAAMHAAYIANYIPGLSSRCIKAASCLYTVTPDAGFVIDFHPESERVIVASPCSGHGFKHSAAIGEALAELAIDGRSHFDLQPFRFSRFLQA